MWLSPTYQSSVFEVNPQYTEYQCHRLEEVTNATGDVTYVILSVFNPIQANLFLSEVKAISLG